MRAIKNIFGLVMAVTILSGCYTAISDPLNMKLFSIEESVFVSYMRDMSASIGRIEDSSIAYTDLKETRALILEELIYLRSRALVIKSVRNEGKEHGYSNESTRYHVYLRRLESNIEKAIVQIKKNPPNLYVAGKIVGACKGCHESVRVLSN